MTMDDTNTNWNPPGGEGGGGGQSSPANGATTTTTTTTTGLLQSLETSRKPEVNKDGGSIPRIVIETEEGMGELNPTDPMMGDKGGETTPTAPDGGYGWFIVLGCFLGSIIIGGLERSDGVYFIEWQKRFHKSAQLTAWPGALVSALRLFLGPLVGAISIRYSVRTAVLMGSFFMLLSIFLNGLAPDFFFLFFSHVLLQGIGRGLLYAPGLILVGLYFDKRRSIATGISSSGVGVGTFVIVPLTQMLFDTYGYTGAFMVLSAIAFNAAVSAMLYRPLSLYYKFKGRKENKKVDEIDFQEGFVLANAMDNADVQSLRSWKAYNSSHNVNVTNTSHNGLHDNSYKQIPTENGTTTSIEKKKKGGCFKSARRILCPVEIGGKQNSKKSIFNLHLLKNPAFLMFCLSISLFTAAFKSAFTFIPPLIKSFGFSETEAAFALSISGVADSIGRVFFGFVFDMGVIRPIRPILYNGFIFCIAIVSVVLPQLTSYAALCLVSAMYGVLTGGYISQKSIIGVDILGVANIASSFGLLIFFQGIGVCIGPPLSGALKDVTGSFIPLFYMGGGLMLCAGFLMVVSNVFLWRQRRREGETKQMAAMFDDDKIR